MTGDQIPPGQTDAGSTATGSEAPGSEATESPGLLPSVVEALDEAGLTVDEYARLHSCEDGRWWGDRCGCPDDRCIGFHHFSRDDCGCFSVELDMALNAQTSQAGLPVQDAQLGEAGLGEVGL